MTTTDRQGALHDKTGRYTEKAAAAPGPGAALAAEPKTENDAIPYIGSESRCWECGRRSSIILASGAAVCNDCFLPGSNADEQHPTVSSGSDPEVAARVLADHQKESWGMGYGSPDRCRCGAAIMPLPGEEEVSIRRDKAFAAHQAEMLTTPPSKTD